MAGHIVQSALVIAKDETGADTYLYFGVEVPKSIPAAEVKRLVDGGFIAKDVVEPEPTETAAQKKAREKAEAEAEAKAKADAEAAAKSGS